MVSSRCRCRGGALLSALLLLFLLTASMRTAQAQPHAEGHTGAGADGGGGGGSAGLFGPLVYPLGKMEAYRRHLTMSTNPLVLFLFDHNGDAVPSFWAPLLRTASTTFDEFGIQVGRVPTSSSTGRQLADALKTGTRPAVLFFQGVGDTPDEGGKGLKVPISYEGTLDVANLVSWALACISSAATHRVHNDEDLARLFALHPQYPALPRVLYFPSTSYTPGGYLTVSQRFYADAVFAVVPNSFSVPDATRVAERYNITSKEELPALVVLHKAASDDGDGDGEADRVVRMPAGPNHLSYREVVTFLTAQIPDTIAALVQTAEATQDGKILNAAEARRMYMATQLVERQLDTAEEERRQLAREPVLVGDQAGWAKHCVQLPKMHRCLVAFVDSAQDPAASETARKVLSIVSVKLLEMIGHAAQNVSLVVVDRRGSDAVLEYFEVGKNGYPDVLLLSFDRPAKYYNFVGAFSAEGIVQFFAAHDPQLSKGTGRGGHAFIARMVPKLDVATPPQTGGGHPEKEGEDGEAGDL